MHSKIPIITDAGATVDAQAPVIVSASRSTDIPAFYAQWFINRLKAGYAVWYNPFNQQQIYVSFKNTKLVVFWTKNPKPLMPYLEELDDKGIHYYFQYTLNDYEREGFEPNLPSLDERIETFMTLAEKVGKEKVIWRFDPIIITPQHTPRDLLIKIWGIGKKLKGYTEKLVFSFVDIEAYRKVQNNLKSFFAKTNIEALELTEAQLKEVIVGLDNSRKRWKAEGWNVALATCAEQIDWKLYDYCIEHNRCIDGELIKRIFSDDADLMYYLACGKVREQNSLFSNEFTHKAVNLKDKGQRKECGCIVSKDIGMYNTCPHYCIYCYANTSKETVKANLSLYNVENESIIRPRM